MAQMVTGTYGPGKWRTKLDQRSPSFDQGTAKRGGGRPNSGRVDMASVPADRSRKEYLDPMLTDVPTIGKRKRKR